MPAWIVTLCSDCSSVRGRTVPILKLVVTGFTAMAVNTDAPAAGVCDMQLLRC